MNTNETRKEPMMKIHSQCEHLKAGFNAFKEIPMGIMNEQWAQKNHGQSLKRLNERGGVTILEALAIMRKRPYRRVYRNSKEP